jgi:KUP system potassium uptake protein
MVAATKAATAARAIFFPPAQGGLVLGALGVVYGDIGTSPLYAFREALTAAGTGDTAVLGALSLVLWALILVISLKYCVFVLRANNHGEGGILALLALLNPRRQSMGGRRAYAIIAGLLGAGLLYGDGAITPAISVLSAVEGITVYTPQLESLILPVTVAILVALFVVQRQGTARVGIVFGPVILVWFTVLGLLGLGGIIRQPHVLAAINPAYAVSYLADAGPTALAVIGGVFLAVTGGEALYADMGHFGRFPIRLAWFSVVLPGLMLNYLGQGALMLGNPVGITSPFYQLAPEWAHWPLIVLATLATVIAAQAIISGAFSMTQQAVQLGFLPRMRIVQTSRHERGQVYVPFVNWGLGLLTLGTAVAFGSSEALAGAYGLAVSLLMVITTVLAALVARRWGWRRRTVYSLVTFFLVIDLSFLAANLIKIEQGGWFPLLVAMGVTFIMLTWRRGQWLAEQARTPLRVPAVTFPELLRADPPHRIPGMAVFLSRSTSDIPRTMVHHLKHNRVLHERVFLVSVVTADVPRVPQRHRAEYSDVAQGIHRIILRFGFMEQPDVPWGLILASSARQCPDIDPSEVTYYVGRETVIPSVARPGMAVWRETFYAFLSRNAELSAAYFGLPLGQVVEVGIPIEI